MNLKSPLFFLLVVEVIRTPPFKICQFIRLHFNTYYCILYFLFMLVLDVVLQRLRTIRLFIFRLQLLVLVDDVGSSCRLNDEIKWNYRHIRPFNIRLVGPKLLLELTPGSPL